LQPKPQPKPELEAVDDQPMIAADLINPSILLMQSNPSIKLLLSRNTQIDQRAIHLGGARLIKIPLGWRLALIRLISRFRRVRLPDEFEFAYLRVETWKTPSSVFAAKRVIGQANDPTNLVQLTCAEYRSLCEMNGRTLHRWVAARFNLGGRSTTGLPFTRRRAA